MSKRSNTSKNGRKKTSILLTTKVLLAFMVVVAWSGTMLVSYHAAPSEGLVDNGQDSHGKTKYFHSPAGKIGFKGRRMDAEKLRKQEHRVLQASDYITSAKETLQMVPELKKTPVVYFITPTYDRLFQKVDLTRIAQALMLDGGVYWIVVEDTEEPPNLGLRKFLYETGLPFAHLTAHAQVENKHRGIPQRNKGIDVVHQVKLPGVIYFADDDNAYDHRLFHELRNIQRVGLFGTGFSGGANYETCVVDQESGRIERFTSAYPGRGNDTRTFPVDMGGFAINVKLLFEKPKWRISDQIIPGFLENDIVASFIDSPSEGEPVGQCTEIYFWHMPKYPESPDMAKLAELPKALPPPKSYGNLASTFQSPAPASAPEPPQSDGLLASFLRKYYE